VKSQELGAGGVGLSVIQGASMTSAYPIIAVDISEEKLELAKRFGATHLINSKECNLKQAVMAILGDSGADVVVENTGNISLIESAYEMTKSQGKAILVGVPQVGHKASLFSLPLHFGKVIKGSHGGDTHPERDIPRYVTLSKVGKLHLKDMITHRFEFSEINTALDMMRSGKITGRCSLKMP
jgi:S-(hydroxymethyl)glutathione dehydrogenase/alcohol dehydrogenase